MEDDSDHELEQMQQYRMREASHPNADLFEEGDELQIVLKPVVKKVKSHDVHAYDCVDIWSLSRSGNKDALIGIHTLI